MDLPRVIIFILYFSYFIRAKSNYANPIFIDDYEIVVFIEQKTLNFRFPKLEGVVLTRKRLIRGVVQI